METENTVNIEVFKGLVSTAPAILDQNKNSVSGAENFGNSLLKEVKELEVKEAGKPDFEARKVLDEKLNKYLIRINETVKTIRDRRTPITGLFDDFKQMFTSLENRISPKASGTFPNLIQETRNKYATDQTRENKRVQDEQIRLRNIEAEKIRVRSEIELQLKKYFLEFAELEQKAFIDKFEGLTLIGFDEKANAIKSYVPQYPQFHFDSFGPSLIHNFITFETVNVIIEEVKHGKHAEFSELLKETILGLQEIYIPKLESKRAELQEIANAAEIKRKADADAAAAKKAADEATAENKKKADEAAAESKRIADEAAAESKRLADEQAERQQADLQKQTEANQMQVNVIEQAANVNQMAMTPNLLFDLEKSNMGPASNVKEGVEIVVKNATGWLQIVAFYFEKEGLKKLPDELGKLKLDQMKVWCEKFNLKTGDKIVSTNIEYKDIYTAKNK